VHAEPEVTGGRHARPALQAKALGAVIEKGTVDVLFVDSRPGSPNPVKTTGFLCDDRMSDSEVSLLCRARNA